MSRVLRVLLLSLLAVLLLAGCQNDDPEEMPDTAGDSGEVVDGGGETNLPVVPVDGENSGDENQEDDAETSGDENNEDEATTDDGEDVVPVEVEPAPMLGVATAAPAGWQPTELTGISAPEILALVPTSSQFAAGSTVEHTVVNGEWMLQIARCYGVTYNSLLAANPLFNPNYVPAGYTLSIPNVGSDGPVIGAPCVDEYTVQAGETVDALAARFGVPADELRSANPLSSFSANSLVYIPRITVVSGQVPALTMDLYFIMDGDLAIWRRGTGDIERFISDAHVVDIAVAQSGNVILATVTRDAFKTMEVVLIDLGASKVTSLETGIADPNGQMAISLVVGPAGDWAAYGVLGSSSHRLAIVPTADVEQASFFGEIPAHNQIRVFGTLFPDADGSAVLWSDGGNGIVSFAPGADGGTVVHIPTEDESASFLTFAPTAWGPSGRYLLADVYAFESGIHAVVDGQSGQALLIPRSQFHVHASDVSWMPDGSLVVISPADEGAEGGPFFEVFEVVEVEGEMTLASKGSADLEMSAEAATIMDAQQMSMPLYQPTDGEIRFATSVADGGVYRIAGNGLVPIVEHAAFAQSGWWLWVPDGSGVLIMLHDQSGGTQGQILFVDLNSDGAPFDLGGWIKEHPTDFNWATP